MDERTRARLIHLIAAWPEHPPRGAVTRFCADNQVSRDWFYWIRNRLQAGGLEAALLPPSPRPRSNPSATDEELVAIACRIRLELISQGWDHGPISVQAEMRDLGLTPPSRATLARIFAREGLVKPQPKKRPRSSYHRFEYPLPNACWQLDALEVPLAAGRTGTVFQLIDDNARLMIASRAAPGETSIDAVAVVKTGIERHGVPQRLLSDNGVALNPTRRGYSNDLVDHLTSLGVTPITGRPGKPTTQGKNERVHQTLQRFLAANPLAADLIELQSQLDLFDDHYNNRRHHQALHGRTPAEAYAALPKATPPEPPTTTSTPRPSPQVSVTRVVDARGSVYVARRQFQFGQAHTGTTARVLHDGITFHLIDHNGTIIDTHHNPPPGKYIPRTKPSDPDETELSDNS